MVGAIATVLLVNTKRIFVLKLHTVYVQHEDERASGFVRVRPHSRSTGRSTIHELFRRARARTASGLLLARRQHGTRAREGRSIRYDIVTLFPRQPLARPDAAGALARSLAGSDYELGIA